MHRAVSPEQTAVWRSATANQRTVKKPMQAWEDEIEGLNDVAAVNVELYHHQRTTISTSIQPPRTNAAARGKRIVATFYARSIAFRGARRTSALTRAQRL